MQITDPKVGPCQRKVVNAYYFSGCNVDDMEENSTYTHIISILIEIDNDNETYIYVSCFNCSLGTSSLQLVPQDDTEYNASIDRLNEIICNIDYKEILSIITILLLVKKQKRSIKLYCYLILILRISYIIGSGLRVII